MGNENPVFIPRPSRGLMRARGVLALVSGLCAALPVRALIHSVTDFRLDSSAAAGDKFHLDATWGDSLLMDSQLFRYTTTKTVRLSNGLFNNGDVSCGPYVSNMGLYKFKVMYLSWKGATHDNATAPPTKEAPRANLVTRIVDLSPDTAAVSDTAKLVATAEVTTEIPPKFIYSNGAPAPTYLTFMADGDNFVGYWGSGTPNGPVRRATQNNLLTATGTYVPPAPPAVTGGFGRLSAAMVPGTNGNKTVLAYETSFTPAQFQVRWETITPAASVASAAYTRPVFPEDFAVGADSNGNSVVMWRENGDLWGVGFDGTHTEIMAPVLLQANVAYNDSIEHLFRPYAVAGMTRGNFLIAYAAVTGAVSDIFTRTLALHIGAQPYALGNAVTVSGGIHYSLFPDLAVTQNRVAVGWYQRPGAGGARRMMGSIFAKAGTGYSLVGRTDLDLASENITFTGMSPSWNRYHWLKSANVAMDSKGNVVAAYDSGTHAKVALVRNTPIYYDSASFLSKVFKVDNPAIPAFVFNPASDSVSFRPFRPITTDSVRTHLKLAVSANAAFIGAGTGFQPLPAAKKSATGFYRYSADLLTTVTGNPLTTNLTTPKLKSLDIEYDIKPATPGVDSIKTGSLPLAAYDPAAAYQLLPRKDSLVIVCRGFDADDDGIDFRISLGNTVLKTVAGTRISPGNFTATLAILPPDTLLNPLPLTLATIDPEGWSSRPVPLSFTFRNLPPAQTLTVYRNRGRDSSGVYVQGGAADTLPPVDGGLLIIQAGDSLGVKVRYTDGNDANVAATWLRNAVQLGTRILPTTDSLAIRFSPDALPPVIDTLVLKAADKDTAVTFRIPVRQNHSPGIDSVYHLSYQGKDSLPKTGPFDKVKDFATDTGLIVPLGLPTVIGGGFSDADRSAGDSLAVRWNVWKQPAGCTHGDFACYVKTDSATGPTLARTFTIRDQYLTVRVTDLFGAFVERRVWLEYPILDTTATGAAGFAKAVNSLKNDIDFIIKSDIHDTIVKAEILSQGTAPLQILSVATKNDDKKWLDLKLKWLSGSPPQPDSLGFAVATNVNAVTGGKTVSLPASASLEFDFRFFSDSLRGDSVLTDTLLILTNDFSNPVLKIPFRLQHRDLPLVRLEVPGAKPAGPAGGFNATGLPALLPARSSIAMVFSETIRMLQPEKSFRVYSYLDSLKNPSGFAAIPGSYEYRRRKSGLGKVSAAADSLADTVVFTPKYAKASDSLKVIPQAGYFIYRDVLHIAVSNRITDKAGNGLDLRLNRRFLNPGTLDTVFQARVDTSRFQVVSSDPAPGATGWSPEGTVKIRFNRKLSKGPPEGTDSLTLLAMNALKGADNRSLRVTSIFRTGKLYDFQFLSLADNDSSLIFRTRPLLPALDTVTVTLSGGILDTSGLSLDGNGDKFPDWLYDQKDSVDAYTLTFITADADFYVYPNPFRFADQRHREKGSITFKNLNSLRGYALGNDVTLRVHTMTGDLVYDSEKASSRAQPRKKFDTSMDWDLMNSNGSLVGTGVYIYSIYRDGSKLLRKGKVAVVR